MTRKIKEIQRFKAKSNDEEIYTVIIKQEFIIKDEFQERPTEVPSHKFAITSNGQSLNPIGNNKFEMGDSGIILTRI